MMEYIRRMLNQNQVPDAPKNSIRGAATITDATATMFERQRKYMKKKGQMSTSELREKYPEQWNCAKNIAAVLITDPSESFPKNPQALPTTDQTILPPDPFIIKGKHVVNASFRVATYKGRNPRTHKAVYSSCCELEVVGEYRVREALNWHESDRKLRARLVEEGYFKDGKILKPLVLPCVVAISQVLGYSNGYIAAISIIDGRSLPEHLAEMVGEQIHRPKRGSYKYVELGQAESFGGSKHRNIIIPAGVKAGKLIIEIILKKITSSSFKHYHLSSLDRKDETIQLQEIKSIGIEVVNPKYKPMRWLLEDIEFFLVKDPSNRVIIHLNESDYGSGIKQLIADGYSTLFQNPRVIIIYYSATNAEVEESRIRPNSIVIPLQPSPNYRGPAFFLDNDLIHDAEPIWDAVQHMPTSQGEEILERPKRMSCGP